MTSKSFSSKGLAGDSIRRSLWALVLSGVGFFLSLLLPVLMTMQRALEQKAYNLNNSPQYMEDAWQGALDQVAVLLGYNPFVKVTFVVMAVVCGVALFAYLHNRQKVDFYHSLPLSRTRLFANNFLTGALCTLSTYFVMLAITLACVYAMGFGEAADWGAIGGTVLCNLIFFLLIYALAVLTTIVCVNTVVTLLLLAWVYFSPLLVRMLQIAMLGKFYETYSSEGGLDGTIAAVRLCPVMEYFTVDGIRYGGVATLGQTGSAAGLLAGYLAAAAVVTALAVFLFRIRKSERAGTALAFDRSKLPIKVYICLIMSVAFGTLFNLIAGDFWFWPGLVIGAVLFHWIVEIIYAFDFRAIFAKPLHLAVMLVVLVGGILLMKADVTGYDTWLPDEGELEAVDVAAYSSREMLSEPENIAAVCRLAEIGVAMTAAEDAAPEGELQAQFGSFDDSFGITLKFRLNGGRMEARYYRLPQTEEVEALLVQLQTSAEYKQKKWDLFCLDNMTEDEVAVLMFTDNAGAFLGNLYDEPEKISEILETLREEELARQESSMPVFRLELAYENRQDGIRSASWSNIYVCEADTRTLALIKQLTGYEPQPQALTADQISTVEIGYVVQRDEEGTAWSNVTVTDAGDIEKLLENAVYADAMNIYNSVFYLGSGAPLMESTDTVNVYATLKDGDRTTELRYLLGTQPTDVIEKYRPDGAADEAAAVIGAAAAAEMPSVG